MMNEFLCAAIVGYHENKHFSVQTGKGDDVGMNNREKVIYSIERCRKRCLRHDHRHDHGRVAKRML